MFGRVECQIPTDAQETRQKVLEGLDWLSKRVATGDYAVVFASGHGLIGSAQGEPIGGENCFAPHDTDLDGLGSSTVGGSSSRATLDLLPATRLLVPETGNSGASSHTAAR